MADVWLVPLQAIWLMLPAYVANMTPVATGGGTPIDFGRTFRGTPLFGPGKTWRGLAAGIAAGVATAALLNVAAPATGGALPGFGAGPAYLFTGLALASGALVGDLVKSFFKRRAGRPRGSSWFPFDQLDFVAGALLFSFLVSHWAVASGHATRNWFFESFTLPVLAVVVVLSPLLHVGANRFGYYLGKKEVPW
ncbi:MAG TPA: CDP-2,3-bis-(O-geranylgeranyl)-sn-glycerol synthase [Candidatus Thermoplasmatota archaeon]|nr:CDP-2,3-bis-(O-geranylgeranyl)-sn-glycerol synthase [Candidatus Thermoplasmatota archaeon]